MTRRKRRSVFDVPNPQTCEVCATVFSRKTPESKRTLCSEECRSARRDLHLARREAEEMALWAWLAEEAEDAQFAELTWPEEAEEDAEAEASWS